MEANMISTPVRSLTPNILLFALVAVATVPAEGQSAGISAIRVEDMKLPVRFLSSTAFQGRNVPSVELEIAAEYLALKAEDIGLEPVSSNGSYFQEIPLEAYRVAPATSALTVKSGPTRQSLSYPESFGVRGRFIAAGSATGPVALLGIGANAPDLGWDDFGGIDLEGKIAVILDAELPQGHVLRRPENQGALYRRGTVARQRGAVAVITVISPEREAGLTARGLSFDDVERGWPLDTEVGLGGRASPAQFGIEVRHAAAAEILGIPVGELTSMFAELAQGRRVPSRDLPDRELEVRIDLTTRSTVTRNVLGMVRGTDPELRDEYVVIGGHHDGIGHREGVVLHGADDNVSGAVAMLELAEAMLLEPPKRSILFAWFTGEEKGLYGAYHFVAHSPVPLEKVSAMFNLDMLSRNDPGSIFVIGSNKISSELDQSLNEQSRRPEVGLRLDYTYEDPLHPDRFFVRSDQYPFIRYGIPAAWVFSGTTSDYHQETDTEDRMDYDKMLRSTRLVFLSAQDIANRPALLTLDLDPRVTSRGPHNTDVNWMRPPEGGPTAPGR
jgi:hypothetical protein